ncbi:MAG: hypothetical protein ACUVTX_08560, partial [Bacteroidales bacterium]
MKLVLKILIWFIAGIIIFITALTVTAMVFRNQVVNVFIKSINNNLSTKFNFENYKLSFVKRFPKASVELTNVTVFSSDSFDRTQFYEYQTDTLFHADLILFEFSINDILNNHYSIQSASVSRGRLSLFSDSTGGINYNVSYVSKGNEDNVKINFEKVVLRDVKTNYHNKATSLNISGVIDNGRFRSRIEGSDIDFLCTSNIYITHFGLYSANFYPDTKIIANISLSKTGDQIIFKKGDLELEGLSFGISGFVRPQNELLLKITGSNIDVAKASKYLPQKYLRKYNEYTPDGFLDAECILSGPLSRTENLHTEITFSVKKGRIYYRKSNIYLKNMNLTGKFNNGYKAGPVTSRIDITQCSFDIGNAVWTANFSVENFNKPLFKLNFSGDIIPDEIQRFVKMPWLVSAEGSLRLNLKLEGFPEKKERYSVTDILNLNPQANIQLKSLTINHKDERFSFNDAAGNI